MTALVAQTKIISVVEDNGQGFDRKNADSPRGGGLLVHIADRAPSMGGTCPIDSSPDEGTRVQASFPLDNALLSPTH